MELFETFRKKIGDIPIIAEDLGFLTPAVHEMLAASGYPGMKVVQFAFGDPTYESEYLRRHLPSEPQGRTEDEGRFSGAAAHSGSV